MRAGLYSPSWAPENQEDAKLGGHGYGGDGYGDGDGYGHGDGYGDGYGGGHGDG
jgi:hypothetical protein